MKTIAKAALGALALASLGAVTVAPASAATSFGFSFGSAPYYGGSGYYGGYYGGNPCFRPYPYRPGYCDYRYRGPSRYSRPYYGRPYGYYGGYPYRDPYWGY